MLALDEEEEEAGDTTDVDTGATGDDATDVDADTGEDDNSVEDARSVEDAKLVDDTADSVDEHFGMTGRTL